MKKAIRTNSGFRVTHINRRRACRLACLECMGWDNADSQVNECDGKMLDGTICALIDFRNMAGKQNAAKRNRAIRNFCIDCMGGDWYLVSKCTSVYCPVYPYRNSATNKSTLFEDSIPDKLVLEMTKSGQRCNDILSADRHIEANSHEIT